MRIARFALGDKEGLGVLQDDSIMGGLIGEPMVSATLDALLAEGEEALRAAASKLAGGRRFAPEDVTFLPPVARPPKIICVGLNYADHAQESGFEQPDYPTFFPRFTSSLIGHEQAIVRPKCSTQLDYEGEIVAVVGTGGRHIPKVHALDHIAGYSIFNDVSVRDYQFKSPQWTMGKNFDATGPMGPAFVSADELPAGVKGLRLTTRLNGNTVQDAKTDSLVFEIDELVSIVSEVLTLEPGDLIVSGTPAGVGFARRPPLFMAAGDVCEVEVEGLGILRNRVVDEP